MAFGTSVYDRRGVGAAPYAATIAVAALLALVAVIIALGQNQARERVVSTFHERGAATSDLVSDYVTNLAANERSVAQSNLGVGPIGSVSVARIGAAFGFTDTVLLNSSGTVLAVSPSDPSLVGQHLRTRGGAFALAARGEIGVSDVERAVVGHLPVVSVAVPFASTSGELILSGSFSLARVPLQSYLREAVVPKDHEIYLVDGSFDVISSTPVRSSTTLAAASPALARALSRSRSGTYPGRYGASTYTSAAVRGTPWRLVIGESNAELYRTTLGLAGIVPWLLFVALCAIAFLLLMVFLRSLGDRHTLARLSMRMAIAAETDELTGLSNRRRLVRTLESVADGDRESETNMTLLLIDVDKFKIVNDTYGHVVGDQVLVAVADVMHEAFRVGDVYGRWGGDEFVAILSDTDRAGARAIAERLRAGIARETDEMDGVPSIAVSIGIAQGGFDTDDLLRRADLALYAAKTFGGNAVIDERAMSVRR